MHENGEEYEFGKAVDQGESNQLRLIYHPYVIDGEELGYDFNRLVWEARTNQAWKAYKTISKKEFDSHTVYGRWISDVHSFDASVGEAIIKVAERDAPRGERALILYSWRHWDINNNQEIAILQECADPFEVLRDVGS